MIFAHVAPGTACRAVSTATTRRSVGPALPAALDVPAGAIRRLLQEGTLVSLRRGVVAGACVVEKAAATPRSRHALATLAHLVIYPEAWASHESAAVLLDLPVLTLPPQPRLTRTRGAWRGGDDVRVRIAPLPNTHLSPQEGVRATNAARTAIDVARTVPFRDAVVVADAVLRICSREELYGVLDDCAAWADLGRARDVARFADPRSESALESVSRAEMHMSGVATPRPQAWVRGSSGRKYRADFLWESLRVIGEADGDVKYTSRADLLAEKRREDDLRRAGYVIVRWGYDDMVRRPAETIARILTALRPV